MRRARLSTMLLSTMLMSLSASGLVRADQWPSFRGPTGDGHAISRNLPIAWSTTNNVLWKREIPGTAWSSPVIDGERVYLTTAVPQAGGSRSDLSLRLVVLRADNGQPISDVEVFRQEAATAPEIHSKNSHASPTPVIDGRRVYVHFGHQGTACTDMRGRILWRNRFDYEPVHGNGGSPLIVDDLLVFSCDGAEKPFIIGLDKNTGQPAWRVERETDARRTFSFSTPTVIQVGDQRQVISPGSNTVDALRPATGELIWRVRYDGYSVIPKPVFGHGLVFVCTGYDSPRLLAIRPDGTGDVTETHVVWRADRNVPHTPSLLLVEDELYMVSDRGIASCLDAKTGRRHWQERVRGQYSASPLYAGGRIYLQNEDGDTTVLEAGKTYREVATSSINERTLASLAAVGDRLFLRGQENLYCLRRGG